MNDPNGIFHHDGWWHLFYQHNPGGDEWADMHWGHARSRDLLNWQHLPIALHPQLAAGELHCYSGCCVPDAAGEPRILYTSVPPAPGRATQVMATPEDTTFQSWTQHVATPVLDLATHDGPAFAGDWRDPYVFQAEGRTFMILGALLGDEAVVPLYENPDGMLRDWTYRGILLRAPQTEVPFYECPSLVPHGDRWILFVSPCREMAWHSGTLDLVNYRFVTARHGRFDASRDYYATQAKIAPDGRILAFGWVRHFPKNRGWNGCLGVIREVQLDATGDLLTTPLAELAALHADETVFPPHQLTTERHQLPWAEAGSIRGECIFTLNPGGMLQMELAGVSLRIDEAGVQFADHPVCPLPPPPDGPVRLEWLLDRSVLELFVNARAVCTQVVAFPFPPVLTVRAEGAATLESGRIWTLRGGGTA